MRHRGVTEVGDLKVLKLDPESEKTVLKGAEIVISGLLELGVDTVFGYPGGAMLPVYDALFDSPIRHILVRHEQGAAHAADGYARSTGKVGVCFATSGPGATNLITGLATAYMDSTPIVAITGQVATNLIGRDSFQEADITGISLPITKHNFLVKDIRTLPDTIRHAFHIASTGRPGPVLIDLPKDVASGSLDMSRRLRLSLPGYRPPTQPKLRQVKRACEAIMEAERPVIIAGGGVIISGASKAFTELVNKVQIPVVTTLMGLGCIPSDHPMFLGMLGMHGTYAANIAIMESDLIIALGMRFDDRATGNTDRFAPSAKIIHIDIDPAEIGKNIDVDIPIVGDVAQAIELMSQRLTELPGRDAWRKWVLDNKEKAPLRYERSTSEIKPQYVIEEVSALTSGRAIIVTDVGQHQMWTAQYYRFKRPRTFITSGGLGTMGYGLPAAVGAQVGRPDERVWLITGDGSIQMKIQELSTVARYDLPIRIVVLNNSYLGMVRQWQSLFYDNRYSHVKLINPDFVKLAEAFNIRAMSISKPEEVVSALKEANATKGPILLDFHVSPEENVYPMVPPGASLDQIIL